MCVCLKGWMHRNHFSLYTLMKIQKLMLCAVALLLSCVLLNAQSPGDLDVSFNGTGWLRIGYPNARCTTYGVWAETDGRIVTAGSLIESGVSEACMFTRIDEDGRLDSTFGVNGISIQALGGVGCVANRIVPLADGKYLACGAWGDRGMLLRLHADGNIDGTFGVQGYVTYEMGAYYGIRELLPLPDGRFMGYASGSVNFSDYYAIVARFHADGQLDTTYGTGGMVWYQYMNESTGTQSAVLQSDGKVVMVCDVNALSTWGPHSVIRLDTNGLVDSSFGVNGVHVFTPNEFESSVVGLAVQSDDKVLVVGNVVGSGAYDQGIFRLHVDGGIDSSFGVNGLYTLPYPSSAIEMPEGIYVMPDDRIVTCGESMNTSSFMTPYVSRILPNGAADPAFGGSGIVLPGLFPASKAPMDLKVMADGRIVVGGYLTNTMGNHDMFVFRLIGESGLGLEDKGPVGYTLGLKVYPNPSNGMLGVRYHLRGEGTVKLEVTDLQGRVHGTDVRDGLRNAGPQEESLDLGEMGLGSGVYLLKVHTSEGSETKKVVYQR